MKKRLTMILSLVMAFVLCFSLAACGNDENSKQLAYNTVSISLDKAIDAANSVINAKGFTGSASVTLSTKNSAALTQTASVDKRGSKIKIISDNNETIVDLQTGYAYYKYDDYYAYDNEFFANAYGYTQYLLASLKQQMPERKFDVRYDVKAKTIIFTEENASTVNKYIEPLISAYKNGKPIGSLLNEYCQLLFGKSFDAMYNVFDAYVSDPKNTVGTLLDLLKGKGLDVEAILEMFDISLPDEQMAAVKARPLNNVIAGAVNLLYEKFKAFLPFAEYDGDDQTDISDDQTETVGGMTSLGDELLKAMLFDDVSDADVAKGMQALSLAVMFVKEFPVQTVIDFALDGRAEAADLYTAIQKGVKLKNLTTTLTLTIEDDYTIRGVKLDQLISHTYKGVAAEGSLLADNNYRATAELVIDKYTTPTADFVINVNPACNYKTSVVSLLYNVDGKDVEVYYEVGGNAVNMTNFHLELETPDGQRTPIENLPAPAQSFIFDSSASAFVFNGVLVKSALEDVPFGTKLCAVVVFDDDKDGYEIMLQYVNDDWEQIYDYAYNSAMDMIMGFVGGAGAPQPPEDSGIEAAQ